MNKVGKYKRTKKFRNRMSLLQKGRKISEEHKSKISKGNTGKIFSEEHKRKIGLAHKNKKVTKKTKRKMSITAKKRLENPKNNSFYNKNHTNETKHKLSINRIGKTLKEMGHTENCKCAFCSSYIDGRTPLRERLRQLPEYILWRTQIFKRDNYTCQECGQHGGDLEAHHIKQFYKILNEFLSFYSQFSPIEDKETLVKLALKWKEFWGIDNGKTLCNCCHNLTKPGRIKKKIVRRLK